MRTTFISEYMFSPTSGLVINIFIGSVCQHGRFVCLHFCLAGQFLSLMLSSLVVWTRHAVKLRSSFTSSSHRHCRFPITVLLSSSSKSKDEASRRRESLRSYNTFKFVYLPRRVNKIVSFSPCQFFSKSDVCLHMWQTKKNYRSSQSLIPYPCLITDMLQ